MKKQHIVTIIIGIAVLSVFCVVIACFFTREQDITDDNTELDSAAFYVDLTESSPDIVLPESEQFSWYKKPFLKATDMRAVKSELYRGNIYSYTPDDRERYHPTEYTVYYVGDKCGIVNSYGEILCDALYTDPYYCYESDGISFDEHNWAFEFDSQQIVFSGGHGGGMASMYYDINSGEFIRISGMEGDNEAVDYERSGVYIAEEAYMEIIEETDEYVSYDYTATGKLGLYNNGRLVIPFEYVGAAEISEGVVAMYDGSTWTYFSSDGDVIAENVPESTDTCSFGNTVFSYSCGCVPFMKDGKWGFMDKTGEMMIDAVFEKALPAFENRAWVYVDGYWGIIEI